jgi:hypothetical protein
MTHITEPRVIGNHADMGPSPTKELKKRQVSSAAPTVADIVNAGRRRRSRARIGPVSDAEPDSGTVGEQ